MNEIETGETRIIIASFLIAMMTMFGCMWLVSEDMKLTRDIHNSR